MAIYEHLLLKFDSTGFLLKMDFRGCIGLRHQHASPAVEATRVGGRVTAEYAQGPR